MRHGPLCGKTKNHGGNPRQRSRRSRAPLLTFVTGNTPRTVSTDDPTGGLDRGDSGRGLQLYISVDYLKPYLYYLITFTISYMYIIQCNTVASIKFIQAGSAAAGCRIRYSCTRLACRWWGGIPQQCPCPRLGVERYSCSPSESCESAPGDRATRTAFRAVPPADHTAIATEPSDRHVTPTLSCTCTCKRGDDASSLAVRSLTCDLISASATCPRRQSRRL